MTIKIPDETKAAWLPLLRDPTTPQCKGNLYDGKGFCCLGVLAKAKGAEFAPVMEDNEEEDGPAEIPNGSYKAEVIVDGHYTDVNDNELLDQEWADQQGITKQHQELLSHLNDGGSLHLANDSPLFDLAEKLAVNGEPRDKHVAGISEPVSRTVPGRVFLFDRHTFAQIADVIEQDL